MEESGIQTLLSMSSSSRSSSTQSISSSTRSDSTATTLSEHLLQARSTTDHHVDTDEEDWSQSQVPSPALLIQAHSLSSMSPKSLLLSLALGPPAVQQRSRIVEEPPESSSRSISQSSQSSAIPQPVDQTILARFAVPAHLDPNEIAVGTYSRAQRAAKIARFKQKKVNRQFRKKVLYNVRKSFADARPRIGGRFVQLKPRDGSSSSTKPVSRQAKTEDALHHHDHTNHSSDEKT